MEPAREDDHTSETPVDEEGTIEVEVPVDAPVDRRTGVYSNFARISSDSDGFTIDFFSLDPVVGTQAAPERAVLQARIRMGHRMGIKLSNALRENVIGWARLEEGARVEEAALLRRLGGRSTDGGDDDE